MTFDIESTPEQPETPEYYLFADYVLCMIDVIDDGDDSFSALQQHVLQRAQGAAWQHTWKGSAS
jgi:hypothetical protein